MGCVPRGRGRSGDRCVVSRQLSHVWIMCVCGTCVCLCHSPPYVEERVENGLFDAIERELAVRNDVLCFQEVRGVRIVHFICGVDTRVWLYNGASHSNTAVCLSVNISTLHVSSSRICAYRCTLRSTSACCGTAWRPMVSLTMHARRRLCRFPSRCTMGWLRFPNSGSTVTNTDLFRVPWRWRGGSGPSKRRPLGVDPVGENAKDSGARAMLCVQVRCGVCWELATCARGVGVRVLVHRSSALFVRWAVLRE